MAAADQPSFAASVSPGRVRLTLAAIASYTVLAPLNSTMIAVALPDVIDDLDVGISTAAWLVTLYLVAMASLQPLAGSLGDRYGRRRLMLGGLLAFGVASIGAALSPDFAVLLGFRVLQAVSIALVLPNGIAIVRDVVPEERRASGFGVIGAASGLAAASGPPIGGLLVAGAGWQAIFLVNVPVVAIALVMGFKFIPDVPPSNTEKAPFDWVGALLLPVVLMGAAAVIMGLARGASLSLVLPAAAVVVVAGLAFLRWEFRHRSPIFQPRLFASRSYAAATTGIAFSNMAMYSLLLAVPLLLTSRGTYGEIEIGFVLLALSIAMLFMTPVGGRLADRLGRRAPTFAGLVMLSLGAFLIATSGEDIDLMVLVIGLAIVGVGVGLSWPGLQTTAVESVGADQTGAASGLYSTSRYFGSIVGSAILAGLISAEAGEASGIGGVFVLAFVAAILAVVASLFLVARPSPPGDSSAQTSGAR